MARPAASPTRHQEILHAIVASYIETGEPVASRTIARRHGSRLSAASIRNVMAELCDDGYLSQPHTSAGRIPTEKAFRSYVQSLAAGRLLSAELQRLREELGHIETVEARIERTSHLLTAMTQGMGIAAAIPTAELELEQIELVSLGERRVLMIVVTGDRMVRDRVVTIDELVTQDELNSIRNYVNENFSGWVLSRIQFELQRRLEAESAAYDRVLQKLTLLYQKGLLDVGLAPAIHTEGASNLVGLDLHLTREKMRELFQALEEKKKVLHLLDCFLAQPSGELRVHVGLDQPYPSLRELSLIGITMALPSGTFAKIAVLGPMRMNYTRAMSAVLHIGQALLSAR